MENAGSRPSRPPTAGGDERLSGTAVSSYFFLLFFFLSFFLSFFFFAMSTSSAGPCDRVGRTLDPGRPAEQRGGVLLIVNQWLTLPSTYR